MGTHSRDTLSSLESSSNASPKKSKGYVKVMILGLARKGVAFFTEGKTCAKISLTPGN